MYCSCRTSQGPRGYRGYPGEPGPRGYSGEPGQAGANGAAGYCAIVGESGDVETPCPELTDAAAAEELDKLKGIVYAMARQNVIAGMTTEQRVRHEGGSGITETRNYDSGDKTYYEASYTNIGFANIHNHANLKSTIGMGEIGAVLNGVEFWTRHNDYSLQMADPISVPGVDYHQSKDIETPEVPPEVLAHADVDDQAYEMRRWFMAWQDQDPSCPSCIQLDAQRIANNQTAWDPYPQGTTRNFLPYFTPSICILEGAWIQMVEDFEQAFESDRHFTDAKTWAELYDKNRFLYQSGRKSTQENLPNLPMALKEVLDFGDNESVPSFATWEYRIVCSPMTKHMPLYNFKLAPDL